MENDAIVIVGGARTAIGSLQGQFKDLSAAALGAEAMKAAIAHSQLSPSDIDDVIMGCVLMAGQGQAPTRQALINAGIPNSVGATTINKMCGSGLQAVIMAHDRLLTNSFRIMLAGGMESMTHSPYLLPKARAGYRMGHGEVKDSMFLDGLEDAYETGTLMGVFAERTAEKYGFSRETQDEFALLSLSKAKKAIESGVFVSEIAPVTLTSKTGQVMIDTDQLPLEAKPEKIPQLKPAFKKDGTVTAANSSGISDGAAALVLMRESEAKKRGLTPKARIVSHACHAQAPDWFTTAPVGAVHKVLQKAGWTVADVDLFEINEAFSVVTLAAMHDLHIPQDKINVHGGACALGHPIGASGARILVTLMNALQKHKKQKGVATLCIGGGEAVAMAIELISPFEFQGTKG